MILIKNYKHIKISQFTIKKLIKIHVKYLIIL
jgi:hypothetical protein